MGQIKTHNLKVNSEMKTKGRGKIKMLSKYIDDKQMNMFKNENVIK